MKKNYFKPILFVSCILAFFLGGIIQNIIAGKQIRDIRKDANAKIERANDRANTAENQVRKLRELYLESYAGLN
jgi:hypothetical protein